MSFPATRLRRLRASESLRALVRETSLTPQSLVAPLFVCHGENVRRPIASMPGHAQISVDLAVEKAKSAIIESEDAVRRNDCILILKKLATRRSRCSSDLANATRVRATGARSGCGDGTRRR